MCGYHGARVVHEEHRRAGAAAVVPDDCWFCPGQDPVTGEPTRLARMHAHRLRTLATLEPGWYDGHGEPPTPAAMRACRALLEAFGPDSLSTGVSMGLFATVEGGFGLALLPAPLLRTRPQIMVLHSGEPGLRRPLWVMMHPDVQHTARMRVLFDFLCERLALDVRHAHDPR